MIIGHTVFIQALAYRTIVMRLQSLGPSMIEASTDLGASPWQTFTHIVLPNLKSTLIGAAVLGFALSFDETMITLLVTGTDNTLPIRLWSMMRLGFAPDINALVTIVLGLTVVLCIIAVRQLLPRGFRTDALTVLLRQPVPASTAWPAAPPRRTGTARAPPTANRPTGRSSPCRSRS